MWKDKNIKIILILGILIRLLIMPFFYHPDIKTYHFQSSFLSQGVWNIYDYLDEKKAELPLKEEFVYFPLTYFFLGSYQYLASPFLGGDFHQWLFNGAQESINQVGVFKFLFILKLPYLLIDLLIGFLLTKIFTDEKNRKKIFVFWILNPFSIFLIYFFSNVDILAVLFMVLSLLLAKNQKIFLASLMLGIGSGFKGFPILVLPILFLYALGWRQKVLSIIPGLLAYLLIIIPFLNSSAFVKSALASGLTTRIFIPNISLGFNEQINIPLLMIAIYLGCYFLKASRNFNFLAGGFLSLFLIIFSFIHFHIQWLLWVIPFSLIVLVKNPKLMPIFVAMGVTSLIIPVLYDDKFMNVALLSVIGQDFTTLPNLFSVVQKFIDPYLIQGLLHTIFAGLSLVLVLQLLREQNET